MRAATLAIGSELLGSERAETNSLRVAACLAQAGVTLARKAVVGDDIEMIAAAVVDLAAEVDVLIVSGGLGPTTDDCTRAGVALGFGLDLDEDPRQVAALEARYAGRGRPMAAVNRRQAAVLAGATVLDNARGSAPGQRLTHEGATVFLLPGPPRELVGMLDDHVAPWLAEARGSVPPPPRHVLRTTGVPESEVEQRLLTLYERYGRDALAILARPGEVTVIAQPADANALEPLVAAVRAALGTAIFAEGSDATLVQVVGDRLRRSGKTVTTAESCTGGLLGGRFTDLAGSSAFYLGGVVTYSNELKEALLGVPHDDLATHGAVSAPVAEAMARGVRRRLGSDYGIGITGIAGPGGGSDEKPVGTVFLALAGEGVGRDGVLVERAALVGDRDVVRALSVNRALDMLRHALAEDAAVPADLRREAWVE